MNTKALVLIALTSLFAGGAGTPNSNIAHQCKDGLEIAYQELDFAKAKGFSGTADYTKAVSLLGAASIQKEFEKYPNCINKVGRARSYIRSSQQ
jgi:hypothetical protein